MNSLNSQYTSIYITAPIPSIKFRFDVSFRGYLVLSPPPTEISLIDRVFKLVGTDQTVTCGASGLRTSLTQDMIKWTTQRNSSTEDMYGKLKPLKHKTATLGLFAGKQSISDCLHLSHIDFFVVFFLFLIVDMIIELLIINTRYQVQSIQWGS